MSSKDDLIAKINFLLGKIFETLLDYKIYIIGGTIWLIICLVLVYLTYDKYLKPLLSQHKLNEEYVYNNNNNKNNYHENIRIILFKTEWCPYCKACENDWNQFTQYIDSLNVDYKINYEIVDCDSNKEKAYKFDIKGYPTVKLIYKNKIYDFDGKVTKDNLVEFLHSIK